MNERQYQVVRVIQKLELFKGLEAEQVQRLLPICRFQDFEAGDEVYAARSQSREMLILLTGRINVIGEMGVFTGEPRSAAIVASEKSRGIAIARWELEKLLEANEDLYIKVLKNLVTILSSRLVNVNSRNEENIATMLKMQDPLVRATGKPLRELEDSR